MSKRRSIVGLDLGRHSVKAVWVTLRAGGPVVTRSESLHVPLNEQKPERLIRPWLESHGLLRQGVVLAVPGSDTVFQSFQLPPEDPRTPAQAAAMEVAKFNDIASETMTYGFAPYARKGATKAAAARRLLLMMTRPAALNTILGQAESLGLNVQDLVPAPAALFNLAQAAATAPGDIEMVVNAGHTHTEVVIGSPDGMLFARSFRTGGVQLTEALQKGGGMSLSQADTFKVTRVSRAECDAETVAKLDPAIGMWLGEIRNCLSAFRHQIRDEALLPKRVVLAGGTALLHNLDQRVNEATGLPVIRAGSACSGLLPQKAELFAAAAGLAVTALEAGPLSISLLPEFARHELVFREKKPFWIASGAAVALTVGVLIIGGIRTIGRQSDNLQQAERLVTELRRLTERIEEREAVMARLQQQGAPVNALLNMGPRYRELINLVADSLDPQDWISMVSDEYSYYAPDEAEERRLQRPAAMIRPGMRDPRLTPARTEAEKRETAKPPPPLPVRFIVEGYTPKDNLSTVQDLIRRLMASDQVVSADLIYDDQKVPPDRFRTWATDIRHSHFVVLVEMGAL